MWTCYYASSVLGYKISNVDQTLDLNQYFTSDKYIVCYHCYNPLWVCHTMVLPCTINHSTGRTLVCRTLTITWLIKNDFCICWQATQDFNALINSCHINFQVWFGKYVNKFSGQNNWVTNVTLVFMNLWHSLANELPLELRRKKCPSSS